MKHMYKTEDLPILKEGVNLSLRQGRFTHNHARSLLFSDIINRAELTRLLAVTQYH